jgi:Tetratricopeptide repeat/Anaphase-promoting complex subunit 5
LRGPGRVGWAWIDASTLAVVLGAGGFWLGGPLGAGIGIAAGGLTPLLIERATRRQEADESAVAAGVAGRRYGPAHLLEPGLGVVAFTGREDELAALRAWCVNESAGPLRLVTGGGGVGKSRLAAEFCTRMEREGWRWLRVAEGAERDAVGAARRAAPTTPLLLVVDYAEARAGLAGLLEAVARDDGRLRVMLLARQAGEWWARLEAGAGPVRDLVTDAGRSEFRLSDPLVPGMAAGEEVRRAVPFFAQRLDVPAPADVQVTNAGGTRVLDLHAAALVAVLVAQDQPAGTAVRLDLRDVLRELLGHERHYWQGRADALGLLSGAAGLTMKALARVVAVSCLLGAATRAEAVRLAERAGVAPSEMLAEWLRALYPPDEEMESWLGSMRPDRLAELHVTTELAASPELAQACLTGLDERQARQALILLARASAEHQAAEAMLERALFTFPQVVAGIQAPREVMIAVANAIPYPSVALADAGASITGRIVATYPAGTPGRALWLNTYATMLSATGQREEALAAIEEAVTTYRALTDAFLPDLAMSLNNQSGHLADLGQREEALAAIEEAVTTYRALTQAHPDTFLPDLATSLNNLSNRLGDLGRREDALTAIEEAVTAYRALTQAHPDTFLPDLAKALNNQSNRLADLGRREEALTAIHEALTLRRALAQASPDAFLPNLATSLNNQSSHLAGLGRREEALAAIEEAVTAYRALAQARPDSFLHYLAGSLNNQSVQLSALGRWGEALAAIEEAVTAYRALAQAHRDTFLPDLAKALNNQSNRLADLGQREDALAAIEEAVTAYRTLAQARPDAFLPDLAMSLNNQSVQLSALGRREEALAAIDEALTLRRALAQARPDAFLPDLAMSLNNQSLRLADLGRQEEALAAIEEAVTAYRALAQARPDAFLPELAISLNNQSLRLADLGRQEEALAAIQEAVTAWRTLAQASPDAFLSHLATSLNNQSSCLANLGRREDALTAIEEAVAIRRALADARPDAFLPSLATSLSNLARLLSELGRHAEAESAEREARTIRARERQDSER